MSEYLSKEEIKQWRSSLEKITLEEFAARLGKKIEESKPSHDLADIVLKGQPVVSDSDSHLQVRAEKLNSIAERAMNREREISTTPFSIKNIEKTLEETPVETTKKTSAKKAKETKKQEVEKPLVFFSVCKNRDSIAYNFRNQIYDPHHNIADTSNQPHNSDNKRYDISRFNITENSINTSDNHTEEKLQYNLRKLRKAFVGFCDGCTV